VLADQFGRLRDGDRFWYQRAFSGSALSQLEGTTLAGVIRRNTALTNLQNNVFVFQVGISGTVFGDNDRDGRLGTRERGLAGQTVELVDAVTGELVASTTTDAGGAYRFDVSNGLGLGQFRVRVALPAGRVQTTSRLPVIDLVRGDTFATRVDIGLSPAR
jgi:peroxidase